MLTKKKKNQMTAKQHVLLSNSVRTMCSTLERTPYLEKQSVCVLQSACSESDREVVCEASAAHSVKVLLK